MAEIFHQKAEANQISLTNEWISKMWHIHTMEYYSAIKRHEVQIMLHDKPWKQPKETKHKRPLIVWFCFYEMSACA